MEGDNWTGRTDRGGAPARPRREAAEAFVLPCTVQLPDSDAGGREGPLPQEKQRRPVKSSAGDGAAHSPGSEDS